LKPKKLKITQIFALIEISIGTTTFISILISLIAQTSRKPLNVLVFVMLASLISLFIGLGLLFKSRLCLTLLLYFSFSIILSKILIFSKIIYLAGALETNIPEPIKNIVSLVYHSLIIWYFHQKQIKAEFA